MPRQLPGYVHRFINRAAELSRLNAILPAEDGASAAVSVCVVAGTAGAVIAPYEDPRATAVRERLNRQGA
ncbi:hypothetical protein [Streptomyces sp. NPDC059479]|uniref:hypothetical protein n=1 Tax=Streptomyces sp. NPDC059479 TaxID=3346848 RepID=UPI00369B68DE